MSRIPKVARVIGQCTLVIGSGIGPAAATTYYASTFFAGPVALAIGASAGVVAAGCRLSDLKKHELSS